MMTDPHKTWLTWFEIGRYTAPGSGVTGWKRMHVIPRNRFFNIYLHRYAAGFRDGREYGLHDHPWWSISIRLRGKIEEEYRYEWEEGELTAVSEGFRVVPRITYRPATWAHALRTYGPAMTLFITGPRVREWGFYTEDGWMSAKELE